MAPPAPPLAVTALVRRYGDFTAVDGLDLEVRPGEIVGFLGPNGAGKTTTLRVCAGLLRPDGGEVRIAGCSLAREPLAARARLGFVPDRPFLYDRLSALEFLDFVAALYDVPEREVAAPLIHDPPLLLLDEPLQGLDPQGARVLKDLLRERAARGLGVLVSTHLLEVAERLCDRVVILHRGRKLAAGTLAELRGARADATLEDVFLALTREGAAS